jgi:hypothetical protein
LTGVFSFGLPILDRIESPTAAVTKRLYSNLALTSHRRPPIRRLSRPRRRRRFGRLLPVVAVSAGCCACLRRLPRSSCRRRLRTSRLVFINRAAQPDASSEGRLGASLPAPCLCGLHRRSVFAVIARYFTDNDARVPICVPSSRTWRVQRRRQSDQPIWRTSTPSTSLSTSLPLFEHRTAAASPLRAVASPPLVPAAGYQCAFSGMYVAGGSHAAASTCALQPRRPIVP